MEGGVTTKNVKLKVLYTFDSEHKNNHLARWPHDLEIQAAQLDETLIIGIINLRTCLEAVTSASPELTSTFENDYTVYAYDYSEPDTPLVGQGMLSKMLTQDSNQEMDSEAMVTGRITKSVMGLFSKNAAETLEVKLRLTPVSSGYTRRRSGSVSSNPDGVQQQWNSLSQTNGAFRPSSPIDTSGLETMQRMLSESGAPRDFNYQRSGSRPASRNGSMAPSQNFNTSVRQTGLESRPQSRSGSRQISHARRDSFNSGNSGYFSGEDNVDEGPARKRARIIKADVTASDFNIERQPDSLRVAASTASSVRLHRPIAQYPGKAILQNSSQVEEAGRPPTPIPKTKPTRPRGRPRKVVSANLLRGSAGRRSSPALRPEPSGDTSVSSPEDVRGEGTRPESVTSTPADLPSSPPVMPEQQNFVTSPALPPFPTNTADSGFMSGNVEDLFDEEALLDFGDFLNDKPEDMSFDQQNADRFQDTTAAATLDMSAAFDDQNDIEQPSIEMPPPERIEPNPSARSFARPASYPNNHATILPPLAPASTANRQQLTGGEQLSTSLPQIPASDPVERTFQRSNTWGGEANDMIMSDIGPGADGRMESKSKKKVGKEQTRARLENAIAQGQMPPFCDNCGSIETPAWRRAFTKIFNTPYDDFQTSLEQGECCYKEPMEHNADGSVKLWKGYRAEKRPDEKAADVDGWTQICLCNPCGLWFHKSKCPRPPEKWQKRDPNEKRKRKRGPKPKRNPHLPRVLAKSDAVTPASDDSSPGDEGQDGDDFGDSMTVNDDQNEDGEPQLPPVLANHRAGSTDPDVHRLRSHASRANMRQVQSSPVRVNQRTALIELDLTPKPVRRQLFPSPGSLKEKVRANSMIVARTEKLLPSLVRRSPRLNKVRDALSGMPRLSAAVAVDGEGKENIEPLSMLDDGFEELFGAHMDDFAIPPMTPTPKRRSERILLKTPGRTPSREFGMAISPNSQRESAKTPKNKTHPAAAILINTVQRNLNPSDMTPFTRSIHEALNNPNIPGFSPKAIEYPETPKVQNGSASKDKDKSITRASHNLFDFPDLPSLKDSSPNCNKNFGINFSELTTDQMSRYGDIFSTDGVMPSSPPQGYFDFVSIKDHEMDSLWDKMIQDKTSTKHPELDAEQPTLPEHDTPRRRSPRKHNL